MLQSLEFIVAIWGLGLVVAGMLSVRLLRSVRWRHLRRLHVDQRGSYTLSFVIILPVYIIAMLFVLETTFLLVTKIGTIYAAYAGARAAIVQYPSQHPSDARQITEYAARKAFAPFANGVEFYQAGRTESGDSRIEEYLAAYRVTAVVPGSIRYLRAKYLYTNTHVTVETDPPPGQGPDKWDSNLEVTVHCDYGLHFPIFGRLLGFRKEGSAFYQKISHTVTLQNEGPQNDEQKLGIGYASPNS